MRGEKGREREELADRALVNLDGTQFVRGKKEESEGEEAKEKRLSSSSPTSLWDFC